MHAVLPWYQGRVILPVLGKVTATRYTDRVQVRLVSGQSAADLAKRADNLAQGFGALLCRVRSARSGRVVLEFVRRDALAALIPAVPIPAAPDLTALPVGRREDGLPWCVRLKEIVQPNLAPKTYQTYELSPVCTSIRTLATSGTTSSRSGTLGSGSTSSQASVSAVLRGKALPGQNPSGDAARSASAAGKPWLRGA